LNLSVQKGTARAAPTRDARRQARTQSDMGIACRLAAENDKERMR
jgi:hypothetical protein